MLVTLLDRPVEVAMCEGDCVSGNSRYERIFIFLTENIILNLVISPFFLALLGAGLLKSSMNVEKKIVCFFY